MRFCWGAPTKEIIFVHNIICTYDRRRRHHLSTTDENDDYSYLSITYPFNPMPYLNYLLTALYHICMIGSGAAVSLFGQGYRFFMRVQRVSPSRWRWTFYI